MSKEVVREVKPRRKKCYVCKSMKYEEEHYKHPILNNNKIYVCSKECWIDYLEMLSSMYV